MHPKFPNAPYCEGNIDAKIALVGEAPGEKEERIKRPFVGRSGTLLTKALQSAGIIRSSCWLDNVFQFRPKNNNIKPYLDLTKKKHINHTPEFTHAIEQLKLRLEEVSPNVVVAIGGVALYALTGLKGVTNYRGSILESTLIPGLKVIPIIHPRYWMTNYLTTYYSIFDLQRVLKESEFKEIRLLNRNLLIDPTEIEIYETLERYRNSGKPVAFDVEVTLAELSHISFAIAPDDGISIPFIEHGKNYWNPEQEYHIMLAIAELLEDENVLKINQNIAFDASFMFQRYGIVTNPMEDIMVAHSIVYPEYPKGLDFIVSIFCNGEPYYKSDRKTWFNNPFGEDHIFRRYNAMDAVVVCEIYPKLMEELKRSGNYETYKTQVALIPSLVFMACYGINVDVEGLKNASIECGKRIEELQKELNELCGYQINHNSPQQVAEYFYIVKHEKPYTQDGKITTNDRAMKQLAIKGYKEAEIILELRHLSKLKGTYYDTVVDEDGRLRCSYDPCGTKYGRISSSKTIFGTGANLQNQPPDTLRFMRSDPGYMLITFDLSMAENRWVAYYACEVRQIRAFEEGKDLHKLTASLRFHKPIEEITDEERSIGKRMNHSFNYGFGPKSYSLDYRIPLEQAKEERGEYFRLYPGIQQWHNAIREELLRNNRVLTNYFGRKFKFRNRWNHKLFTAAYSFKPQSNVAFVCNYHGYRYIYERQDLFPEVILLNTVHDSVKIQVPTTTPTERIIEIILSIKDEMELEYTLNGYTFTIPVDVGIGFSFSEDELTEWKDAYIKTSTIEKLMEDIDAIKESEGLVVGVS